MELKLHAKEEGKTIEEAGGKDEGRSEILTGQ